MTTGDVPTGVTRGFASYTRADNETFGNVVDRLRQDITAMYEAMTGKRLDLFLDRESIGWGEDWRQKIHESVDSASVFIPIVTMRYFNSQMCMEELLTFHAAANRLGVTELILPIVLFGADQIRSDDPRSEVQLIARLNYKNVEQAWTAGYDSPEWRSFIAECVRDLDKAIQRAETVLSEEEKLAAGRSKPPAAPTPKTGEIVGDDEDEPVLFDLDEMTARLALVEPLTSKAIGELNQIAQLIGDFDVEGVSVQTGRARAIALANSIREPADAIEKSGSELESILFGLDSDVRALVSELSAIDLPEARSQLVDLLTSFQSDGDLSEVETQIQYAIDMIRLVSIGNVTMKKALQPASRGFRSIKNAIGVFRGWQVLLEELDGTSS